MDFSSDFSNGFFNGFWKGFGRVSGGFLRGNVSEQIHFFDSCENVKISASYRRELNFQGSGSFEFVLKSIGNQ